MNDLFFFFLLFLFLFFFLFFLLLLFFFLFFFFYFCWGFGTSFFIIFRRFWFSSLFLLLPLLLLLLLLGLRHLLLHHLQEILVLQPFCLVVHRTTWAIWSLVSFAIQSTSPSTKLGDVQLLLLPNRLRTTFVCLRMFLCQFYVHIWSTCGSLVDICQ